MIRQISVRNAAYQQFETLKRNREKRTRQRLMFLEGVHPIEQAIAGGWNFAAMGYAAGKRLSGWAQDMLKKAAPEIVYEISADLMTELSDREQPCELIALVHQRDDGLVRMRAAAQDAPFYVLFDRPQSPGNLGTVLRSADSFGASGLIACGHSADFYDPQCLRASIGAIFDLPFAALQSIEQVEAFLETLPVRPQIVGTSARGTVNLDEVDLTGPTLLLIGNETFGLSKAWKEKSDYLARIPISGVVSSLNAGCAASICLYEIARQRLRSAR